jgi:hypothetical protein
MQFVIGMPVFGDYDGPVFTSASLLAHHNHRVSEILIVDNKPDSPQSKPLAEWCKHHKKLRYVPFPSPVGTAPPKNAVFDNAPPGHVVCMDSHILLFSGALDALAEFYTANPDAVDDLVQGPLVYDDMVSVSSSLSDAWGGDGVWGQWKSDPELATEKWFQVRAQGMGLFACSKSGWVGFNANFRGFGGEERYIHEKFRQAGKKTWCVTGLRWWHRFGKAAPVKYPLSNQDKCRNYVIGLIELGLPLTDLKGRFVGSGDVSQAQWDQFVSEAEALTKKSAKGCGCKPQRVSAGGAPVPPPPPPVVKGRPVSADELFNVAAKQPSDINEHFPLIRSLAEECKTVTEFASGRATIALIASLAKSGGKLTSYHGAYRPEVKEFYRMAGGEGHFEFVTGDSRQADIAPTEMLFIDTESTASRLLAELEKHHAKVSRYIAVHRTDTYGEFGSDGGPGLRPAIRQFLKTHPDWFVFRNVTANNGLTVLCHDPAKKPKLPGTLTMFKNAAKAVLRNATTGFAKVPLEVMTARLSECAVCENRVDDRCSLCGCYLEVRPDGGAGKTSFSRESCPVGKWLSVE